MLSVILCLLNSFSVVVSIIFLLINQSERYIKDIQICDHNQYSLIIFVSFRNRR